MSDDISFIRDGLKHYPDARATVDYFEDIVQKALIRGLENKRDWTSFRPKTDDADRLNPSKVTGPTARYIYAYVGGSIGHQRTKAWVGIGLSWDPECHPGQVIASCYVGTDKGDAPLRDVPERDERVLMGPLNKKRERRLLMRADSDFDPDEAFRLLLDCLDAALGEAVPSGGLPS